jgi:hypothetical protein
VGPLCVANDCNFIATNIAAGPLAKGVVLLKLFHIPLEGGLVLFDSLQMSPRD